MNILAKIKRILNDIDIRTKLLVSFFVMILTPLITLTVLTYARVSKTMEENMLHTSNNAVNQSVTYLEAKLEMILNALDIIYFNQTLHKVVSSKEDVYNKDIFQQYIDQQNLFNLIAQVEKNPDIFHVRLYIRFIEGFFYDKINFNVFENLESSSWYRGLETLKPATNILPPQYFASEENGGIGVIPFIKRMNIKRYYETDALIRIDMRESVVSNIVSQANITRTGLTYIVNQYGEIISSSGNLSLLENTEFRKKVEDQAYADQPNRNIVVGSESFLTIQKNVRNSDWQFISVIPYKEIRATGESIRLYMYIIMLITCVVSYMIAYFITNTITKRLRNLAESMKKVTSGDFNVYIHDVANDEIGQLTHDFNYMVSEMSGMIRERYETGKRIKSLELISLQSQINPHFLYNSLDMINWSASMAGNEEIVDMVQSLSRFYKIGLSKGQEIIPIRNEIEHVKAYVNIQNLRYGNLFKLEIDTEKELETCGILKITLQPIVENAILHGILKKESKSGTIKIAIHRVEDQVVVKVTDDGIGMAEDTLKSILENDSKAEFHGFGVKNTNERIKLQFGQQYGLNFESSPGVGTTVTITLPVIPL